MAGNDSSDQNKPKKGYGKKSLKFWVVLYVIIAIVLYGLIYLLFFHKSSAGGSAGGYGY